EFEGNAARAPLAAVWELRYDAEAQNASGTRRTLAEGSRQDALELIAMAWLALDADERPSAFSLHDRSIQAYANDDVPIDWRNMPYEMALLNVPMDEGAIETLAGGAQYRYAADPRTKFMFPRAVAFPGGEKVAETNAILSCRHY